MQEEEIRLNISINDLSKVIGDVTNIINSVDDGKRFLDKKYDELTFSLDYPLERSVEITIFNAETIADILVPIANCYKDIYKQPEKYGVWGHSIEDLYFERLLLKEEGYSHVFIGS